jgi:hypothetical protein
MQMRTGEMNELMKNTKKKLGKLTSSHAGGHEDGSQ